MIAAIRYLGNESPTRNTGFPFNLSVRARRGISKYSGYATFAQEIVRDPSTPLRFAQDDKWGRVH